MNDLYDEGESHAENDVAPEDIDWDAVEDLQILHVQILGLAEGEKRSLAMAELLVEMYGQDLEVL